jgi:hypothetical protein
MNWLGDEQQKIAFFLNLHNFLILFALCKHRAQPKSLLEWVQFKEEVAVNVGRLVFSALDIEVDILKTPLVLPTKCFGTSLHAVNQEVKGNLPLFAVRVKFREVVFGLFTPTK